MPYSDKQREYWSQRPANIIKYDTVEFYHPDFGYIRLVANIFEDREFQVDGSPQLFRATSMDVPSTTDQTSDNTQAGSVNFGRIGTQFRNNLLKITPFGAITYPITATIRTYRSDVLDAPVYERKLFVDNDGIGITSDGVSVKLSVNNPSRLKNNTRFYDPAIWIGLQDV